MHSSPGISMFMIAHVVPIVCASLRNQELISAVPAYPHLRGLLLADFQTESSVLYYFYYYSKFSWLLTVTNLSKIWVIKKLDSATTKFGATFSGRILPQSIEKGRSY